MRLLACLVAWSLVVVAAPVLAPTAQATEHPPEPAGSGAIGDPAEPTTPVDEGPVVDPAAERDECRNIDGLQTDIPEGHYDDGRGNCLLPVDLSGIDADDIVEEPAPVATGCVACEAPSEVPGGAAGGEPAGADDAAAGEAGAGQEATPPSVAAHGTAVAGDTAGPAASVQLPFTGSSQLGQMRSLGMLLLAAGAPITTFALGDLSAGGAQALAATSSRIAGTTSATARDRNDTGVPLRAPSRAGVAASRK